MSTVTIPKKEYQALKRHSKAYQKLTTQLFKSVVQDDVGVAVADFAATKRYTKGFLADLERGLRKSSYGKS